MPRHLSFSPRQTSKRMEKNRIFLIAGGFLALSLLLAAGWNFAAGSASATEARIRAAVAATLAAQPTQAAAPTPTVYAPPTPLPLDGLFCEYGFCIGHPQEIALVDAATIRNPAAPSARGYGILFGFSPSLFLQVIWTGSSPSFDYRVAQRYLLEEKDQLSGEVQIELKERLTVYYQTLSATASDTLPSGLLAVWQCGDRDFGWKTYTPRPEMGLPLMEQALQRFRCQ